MKLNEIMMFKDVGDRTQLKLFQVDDDTLAKMTKIRGTLYRDDPRLRIVKDLPEHKKPLEPGAVISDEMLRRAEESYRVHKEKERPVRIPEPVLSFEEQLAHDWRHSPSLRKEFTSQASYAAFKKAEKQGRTRLYGRA